MAWLTWSQEQTVISFGTVNTVAQWQLKPAHLNRRPNRVATTGVRTLQPETGACLVSSKTMKDNYHWTQIQLKIFMALWEKLFSICESVIIYGFCHLHDNRRDNNQPIHNSTCDTFVIRWNVLYSARDFTCAIGQFGYSQHCNTIRKEGKGFWLQLVWL